MCRLCRSFPASPAPLGLALAPPDRGAILSPLMKIMTEILPTQGQAQRCAGGVPAGCHPRPLRGALRGRSAAPPRRPRVPASSSATRAPFRVRMTPAAVPSFSYPSKSSGDIIQVNCVSRSALRTLSSRAGPRAQRVPWLIVPHPRPVPPGLFQMPSPLSGSPRPTQPQALLHPTQGGGRKPPAPRLVQAPRPHLPGLLGGRGRNPTLSSAGLATVSLTRQRVWIESFLCVGPQSRRPSREEDTLLSPLR